MKPKKSVHKNKGLCEEKLPEDNNNIALSYCEFRLTYSICISQEGSYVHP